jgi:hypothetical protein
MDQPTAELVSSPPAPQRAVVCVDGIVGSALKPFTPDLGWGAYTRWLGRRRPDLAVAHLTQPHDWLDILSGRAEDYPGLVRVMLRELLAQRPSQWREVAVLGFSLGGLTALSVAHEFSQRITAEVKLESMAYVTFGTPFGGTHLINDLLLRRMPISYLERIYARRDTLQYLRELVRAPHPARMSILLHAIRRDELVSRESALLPAEWLEFAAPGNDVRWGEYEIDLGRFTVSPHNSFPLHPVGLAYVDGIVDGLFPPEGEDRGYEPFELLPAEAPAAPGLGTNSR